MCSEIEETGSNITDCLLDTTPSSIEYMEAELKYQIDKENMNNTEDRKIFSLKKPCPEGFRHHKNNTCKRRRKNDV